MPVSGTKPAVSSGDMWECLQGRRQVTGGVLPRQGHRLPTDIDRESDRKDWLRCATVLNACPCHRVSNHR